MELFVAASVFVYGLLIGSFLNVCIYRLPRDKSIISPPSTCPNCNTRIKPWHNIPVVSYLVLRGRCGYCGSGISPIYPAIELLNAFTYLAVLTRFGLSLQSVFIMVLLSAFIVVMFIDLEHKIIPDEITLPGILIGLAAGPLVFNTGFVNSLVGLLVGGGSLLLAGYAGKYFLGKESMGGGDVKLMAMIGAFFGWKTVFLTIFIGSALGSVVGVTMLALRIIKRENYIPFGPFLVAGAVLTIFFGRDFLKWLARSHLWL